MTKLWKPAACGLPRSCGQRCVTRRPARRGQCEHIALDNKPTPRRRIAAGRFEGWHRSVADVSRLDLARAMAVGDAPGRGGRRADLATSKLPGLTRAAMLYSAAYLGSSMNRSLLDALIRSMVSSTASAGHGLPSRKP